MNEILHRGKAKDKGFVEGNLLKSDESYYILPYFAISSIEDIKGYVCDKLIILHAYEVDKSTICQYSELTDMNKTKIFENDIVKDDSGDIGIVKFGIYDEKHYGFYIEWVTNSELRKDIYFWTTKRSIEVVGNVFDDAGLLKEV